MLARFEELGERLTRALVGGDFALYRSVIRLPMSNEPRDEKPYVLRTETDLEEDFRLYCNAMRLNKVQDIHREVLAAARIDKDWYEVTVRTNLLGPTGRVVEPFVTQFILRPDEDDWRIAGIRSDLGHINWTLGRAMISADGTFVLADSAPHNPKTGDNT